jgi:hypothetical protein
MLVEIYLSEREFQVSSEELMDAKTENFVILV